MALKKGFKLENEEKLLFMGFGNVQSANGKRIYTMRSIYKLKVGVIYIGYQNIIFI